MTGIEARFRCRFPGFELDVDLTLPGQGVTALFGHSGCGKTTLLRCMAGLQRAPGRMIVAGETWQDDRTFRPVHRRPLAYVFQDTRLFPHLSVRGNLDFGYRRIPAAERRIHFDDAVDWLGLAPHLDRRPDRLSGGERQRVAIARALLGDPPVLLLDEPSGNLDAAATRNLAQNLKALAENRTIVVVTHSPDLLDACENIVAMDGGRIVAAGPAAEVRQKLAAVRPGGAARR